jgi:hypothetical protein
VQVVQSTRLSRGRSFAVRLASIAAVHDRTQWLVVLGLLALAVGLPHEAVAQTSISSTVRDAAGLIKAGQSIKAYGTDLFGDSVNLYTGGFSLEQTDLSIPGNNSLPVGVMRRFSPKDAVFTPGALGDWELDLPSIGGQFATGTRNNGWNAINQKGFTGEYKRCTSFGEPEFALDDTVGTTSWEGFEYWQGTSLRVPGGGGEVLYRSSANTSQPTDGNTWPLVTKGGWQLRCLPSLHASNLNSTRFAKGEGFIAIGPDGTTYRFDWLVVRPAKRALKVANGLQRPLAMSEISIHPTLVTDRFGNTVTYTFNPSSPNQLLSIASSDGRQINFTYVAGTNRIQSFTDGVRTWTYSYTAAAVDPNAGVPGTPYHLTSVTQPDGSAWAFALQPLHKDLTYGPGATSCPNPMPSVFPDDRTGTITHPSGAIGTFTTRAIVFGRKVATSCTNAWDYRSGGYVAAGWSWSPLYWASRALVGKSISGPGVPAAMTWTWTHPTAQGGLSSCTGCPDTKAITVTNPRGYVTRHVYGIYSLVNEGQLQQLDEVWNGSSAQRSTTFHYRDKAAGPYPSPVGFSANPRVDALEQLHHSPQDQRVVSMPGQTATFTWSASTFDIRARATTATRSTAASGSWDRLRVSRTVPASSRKVTPTTRRLQPELQRASSAFQRRAMPTSPVAC